LFYILRLDIELEEGSQEICRKFVGFRCRPDTAVFHVKEFNIDELCLSPKTVEREY